MGSYAGGKSYINNTQVQFKIQPQAAGVKIGRTNQRPYIIDQHELGMDKRGRLVIYLDAAGNKLPQQ